MARAAQRVVLMAIGIAVAVGGSAEAQVKTSKHDTTVVVHHVAVTPKGRVLANGRLRSGGPACRAFNFVDLMEVRSGRDEFLDLSVTSLPHGAWATRSDTGVAQHGSFYVKTDRQVIHGESISSNGRHHRRRIVCRADRAGVKLPAGSLASAPSG